MIQNRFKQAESKTKLAKFDKGKLKSARKQVKTFMKIYNSLCPQCRAKTIRTPEMKFSEYCEVCKQMIKDNGGEE